MLLHYPLGTAAWLRSVVDVVVIAHIAGGVGAVAAGVGALAFRKGGRRHRRAGTVFFVAMLTLGGTAAVIGLVLREPGNVFGGLFVCYLVATAWMTVRRPPGAVGGFEVVAMLTVLAMASFGVLGAMQALSGQGARALVAAAVTIAALAAVAALADVSVILRRGLAGAQRITRHLWRMCVAFAMAAGAFVTQPSMFPRPIPILLAAALLPLALMVFWLLRVALTDRFKADHSPAFPTQAM